MRVGVGDCRSRAINQMASEFQGRQELTESSDCKLESVAEPRHNEECLDLDGSNKITPDFPSTSACSSSRTMMTSQQPLSEDSGSIPAASSSDQAVGQGVQTLKALSLNGLNQNLCHSTSASEDSNAIPSGVKGGRPHPILSWGDVTEIPNGATGKTQEYMKHPIGSSSGSDPWQVRSTQNPSRPLVRRPTPMAIRVPKSVLEKASSKMMTQSFEEEDEERELADGEESPVPVSLKPGTNNDVLVIEDVESSDVDSPSPGLSTPKDLSLGLVVEGHSTERGRDAGSPTIVVQTDIGAKLSQEEAEKQEKAYEVENDEEEEEEDDFDVDDKQFLSPTASKSFEKNPEPPAKNSHVKTVPPQPRKLVRRQTPIKLDLPKNLKEMMAKNTSDGIVEEEEEEEEENNKVRESNQQKPEAIQATSNQENEQKTSADNTLANITSGNDTTSSDTPSETVKTEFVDTNTIGEGTSKNDNDDDRVDVPGRPDIIDSVNCNNNNHEASALDLVEGASHGADKSQDRGNLTDNKQDMGSPATQRKSLFKKSQGSSLKDGSGSPSSARRKVSAHHTKILQRQPTPHEIEVPKHIITEAMKKKAPDSLLEEEDENES